MADDIFLTIGVETKGILTAIKTTTTLKNNIEKLIKARERNQINDAQLDASLKKLAKNSGAYGKQVDGVTKSILAANKAQKEAAAAAKQAKEEDRAFAQARREAIAINKEFNEQKKREAAETARAAAEQERLNRKFVEGYAAMEIYSREMNDLAMALKAGIITKEQQTVATARLNQEMAAGTGVFSAFGRGVNQTKGYTNQFGLVTQQVGYQVGDLAVQVQSGTNFFVAFGQQMTQLAGLGAQLSKSMAMIGVFTGLGIAIPIITGILAYMTRTTEETNNAVDAFQRLRDATKELAAERMKLIDPAFDENLQGTQEELDRLTKAYEDAAKYAESFSQATLAAPTAESQMLLSFMSSYAQEAREAADAAVDKAKAELDAYQQEVGLAKAREMNNARIDAQNEQGIRDLEIQQALQDKFNQKLTVAYGIYARMRGEASALANETARAANALPSFQTRQLADQYSSYGAGRVAGETAVRENRGLYGTTPPALITTGSNSSGGGSAPSDPLADLMKRIELEKELLGTSEAYQEVIRAIQNSDKEYSDSAIQGAVARLEAINQEKEALQQMQSLQQSIADTIGDGLMSMVDGTMSVKDAFRSMARDIIKQLYEVLVVQRLVGSAQGGTGIAGLLGGLFANGGAFSAGKQIQAYANGGVVGGPTYFPMAGNKTGLMGEAGPEAIMPLKRGKDGKLGVSVGGGSGSVNVVNNINVSGGSDPAAIRAEVAKLMPQITSATKSAVIDARRRGGQMKAAFS
jgi:hypothetical protein